MRKFRFVDTMRSFIMYWREYSGRSGEDMFAGWLTDYISNYPEILISEVSYWRGFESLKSHMIENVLPGIDGLIHEVIEGWMNLLQNLDTVYEKASRKLEFIRPPIIEIYVGSGWKSRWVSSILDEPALFLDLGGLAELGWSDNHNIRGVLAFGLGQLHHALARGGAEELAKLEEDPFLRLYSQGYAQFLENLVLEEDSWHGTGGESWLKECREKERLLAEKYLEGSMKRDVERFYDPELRIAGLSFTGRYLGYRLVSSLHESGLSLNQLSKLSEGEARRLAQEFLKKLSRGR